MNRMTAIFFATLFILFGCMPANLPNSPPARRSGCLMKSTQGPNNPLCCPNEHRLRSYLLENGALRLASEQILDSPTALATPLSNEILVDRPLTGDHLTAPLQVRGRVSQVPPQKKLVYYITDLNATLLMQGEVSLEGEPGGKGVFAF